MGLITIDCKVLQALRSASDQQGYWTKRSSGRRSSSPITKTGSYMSSRKSTTLAKSLELWWSRSVPSHRESFENNADLGITAITAPGQPGNVSRAPLCSVSYSCGHLPKALASRAMTSTISSTTDFPLGSHPNNLLALIDSPNEVE